MTGKTAKNILAVLARATEPLCRGSGNCRTCPMELACEMNRSSVIKLKATVRKQRPIASDDEKIQRGRYNY